MTALESVLDLLDERLKSTSNQGSGIEVKVIVAAVDNLLSRVLLFRTIVLSEDQGKVIAMCRSVLGKKLEVERKLDNLSMEDLRISVVQLELLLNNCILRLFIDTMVKLQENPLEKLKEGIQGDKQMDRPSIEGEFDLLHDRLIELGVIASGFTNSASGGSLFE